jgi:hypothetical protein
MKIAEAMRYVQIMYVLNVFLMVIALTTKFALATTYVLIALVTTIAKTEMSVSITYV